jgi:hypothetical protein
MYSQSVHYRRLAIQARQRAVKASDSSVAVALEEIANHWTALAEQVEWLQDTRLGSQVNGWIGLILH